MLPDEAAPDIPADAAWVRLVRPAKKFATSHMNFLLSYPSQQLGNVIPHFFNAAKDWS